MGAGAVMSYPFELILCISFRQTFFLTKQTKKKTHPEGLEKRIELFFFFYCDSARCIS